MWWILYIFMRTFFILQKSSLTSWPCSFFYEMFLPQPPVMFSTDFDYSKRDSGPKHFLEVTEGIELLQQNALDKLRFSDPVSEQT